MSKRFEIWDDLKGWHYRMVCDEGHEELKGTFKSQQERDWAVEEVKKISGQDKISYLGLKQYCAKRIAFLTENEKRDVADLSEPYYHTMNILNEYIKNQTEGDIS